MPDEINGLEKARQTAERLKSETQVATPKAEEEKPVAEKTLEVKKVATKPKVELKAPEAEKETALEVVEPAKIENNQLVLTPKHLTLIKTQIAANATPAEFELFIMMARRTRLDPLMRQLYFIKYGEGDRAKVSYVTSIDGYRIIAHRTGDFAGVDEPRYDFDSKTGRPLHCSITVYKLVQGVRCGFSATVKFAEYNTNQNNWAKMPETMIAKVAEAHALRKAFPNDLSGIYTQDEMDQASARNGQPVRPAVQMMTKDQVVKIKELMLEKGMELETVKGFVKKTYNLDSMHKMTAKQADHMIGELLKLPDLEAFDSQEGTAIDLDEVDAGIEAQRVREVKEALA